ncbi:MAG: phage holin family protein [Acidimicrobiales bacterium]
MTDVLPGGSSVPFEPQPAADPTKPIQPDASIGDLLGQVTDDFSQLVRTHIELAKVEIKEEVTRAGKGAGFLTGGAVAGLLAITMLSFALAWGLAEVVDAGFGFLIVGLLWSAVAAVLALSGRKKLQEVHPVPEVTKQTVQEDVQWAKEQR